MKPDNQVYFAILAPVILGYLIATDLMARRKIAPEAQVLPGNP